MGLHLDPCQSLKHFEQHVDSLFRAHRWSLKRARESGKRTIQDLHAIPTPQTETQSNFPRAIGSRTDRAHRGIFHGQRSLPTAEDSTYTVGPTNARKIFYRKPSKQVGGKKGADGGVTPAGFSLEHQGEEHLAAEVLDSFAHKRLLAWVRLDDVPPELFHGCLTEPTVAPRLPHIAITEETFIAYVSRRSRRGSTCRIVDSSQPS